MVIVLHDLAFIRSVVVHALQIKSDNSGGGRAKDSAPTLISVGLFEWSML
jgi:hypothetical protein